MRLATNYAPYEEVMKHSATAWKQAFMENAEEVSGYCVKCVGKLQSGNPLVEPETGSYTAMYLY